MEADDISAHGDFIAWEWKLSNPFFFPGFFSALFFILLNQILWSLIYLSELCEDSVSSVSQTYLCGDNQQRSYSANILLCISLEFKWRQKQLLKSWMSDLK